MPIKHVLVVDDSKAARLVLRRMLQDADLTVDMAESAEEALDYLGNHRPDAIFMDHTMPGMDGLTAVGAIKSNQDTAAIPVAMYTSKEGDAYAEQLKDCGVVSLLPKPATNESLQSVLQQLNQAAEQALQGNTKVVPIKPPQPASTAANQPVASRGASQPALDARMREVAESVTQHALEGRIAPLVDTRVDQLREWILSSTRAAVMENVKDLCETRIQSLSHRLDVRFNAQLADMRENLTIDGELDPKLIENIQSIARDAAIDAAAQTGRMVAIEAAEAAATKVAESQVELLTIRLGKEFREELEHLRETAASPRKLAPELLEELKDMARFVATKKTQDALKELANRQGQEPAVARASDDTPSFVRRNAAAIAAAIIGVGTAIALHVLG